MNLVCACPSCGTRLRVGEEQLAVASGQVRCGACLAVFDGRAHLVAPEQQHPPPADPPPLYMEDVPAPPFVQDEPETDVALPLPAADENAPAEPPQPEPAPAAMLGPRQAARPPKKRAPRRERSGTRIDYRRVGAGAAVAILVLTLLVAVLGVQFHSWSQRPAMRGLYASVCAIVGCELPPLRSLAQISVEDQASARPGPPEQLALSAVLVNRASFAQRFPTLAVRLLAADGTTLTQQRIAPTAYLGGQTSRSMAPNRRTPITLRLDDPGAAAVGYAITLW